MSPSEAAGSSQPVDVVKISRTGSATKTVKLNFSAWFGEKYGGVGVHMGNVNFYCPWCPGGKWRNLNDFSG